MARTPGIFGRAFWGPLLIVIAGAAVYAFSLHGALIFDDIESVVENPHIRVLWPPTVPLTAPVHSTLCGRPVVALSFAITYAISGMSLAGFHMGNLLIHLANALLLFVLLRHTIAKVLGGGADAGAPQGGSDRSDARATTLATIIALIWVVHPLLTEAVVYVVQRTELIVTLFYLFTLYAAVRSWESRGAGAARAWMAVAIASCALGVCSKEWMISAPLLVLLYDRTFHSGSFATALRRHAVLYAGLALSWLILLALMFSGPRGDTVGFHQGIDPFDYLRTQAWAIVWYLRLCFWPRPLAILIDPPLVKTWVAAAPYGVVVLGLLGAAAWGIWRRSWVGVAGALFFMVLAPSSSFIPIVTEVAAERRMYLPSVAVLAVVVGGVYALARRWRWVGVERWRVAAVVVVVAGVTIALGVASVERIGDYDTPLKIWLANSRAYPHSARTWNAIGAVRAEAHDEQGAIDAYKRAVSEEPRRYADPWMNVGNCYLRAHQPALALPWYEGALRIKPGMNKARLFYAQALMEDGRLRDAEAQLGDLLGRDAGNAAGHEELAQVLRKSGRAEEALTEFAAAARLAPENWLYQNDWGAMLALMGRSEEALPHIREAVRLDTENTGAALTLGRFFIKSNRAEEAIEVLRKASAAWPDDVDAAEALAAAYAQAGRGIEAVATVQEAIRRCPASGQRERIAALEAERAKYLAGARK